MRCQMGVASLMAAACATLAASGLHADEECFKGFRYATSTEEAAMRPVLASALRALPSELPGWESYTDEELRVSPQCMDDGPRPWEYSSYRSFERVDDLARREGIVGEAGTRYQTALAASQPAMDRIMARIQELAMQAVAAGEAGDYDRVDAINEQIAEASAEYEALMQGDGALAELDAANEEAGRDRSILIEVAINPRFELLGYEARKVAAPAGAAYAYRWADTRSGPSDATQLVLFGAWRADENGFDQSPRSGAAQATTQGLSLTVTADESRIDSVLGAIDFRALAALISR